jgi:hypothetical protein
LRSFKLAHSILNINVKKWNTKVDLVYLDVLLSVVDAVELFVDVEVEADMLEPLHILHPHLQPGVHVLQVGCSQRTL